MRFAARHDVASLNLTPPSDCSRTQYRLEFTSARDRVPTLCSESGEKHACDLVCVTRGTGESTSGVSCARRGKNLCRQVRRFHPCTTGGRDDYNHRRPHSSLGALTPVEFAQLTTEKLTPAAAGENNQRLYL